MAKPNHISTSPQIQQYIESNNYNDWNVITKLVDENLTTLKVENPYQLRNDYLENQDISNLFGSTGRETWFTNENNQICQHVLKNVKKVSLTNIQFDANMMKETLRTIFTSQITEKSPQSLDLTTANTMQEALSKFNQRFVALNHNDQFNFEATLQNPNTATDLLSTQYNLTLTNNNFHLDVNLTFVLNGEKTDLGQYRVCLGDVLIDSESQQVKTTTTN